MVHKVASSTTVSPAQPKHHGEAGVHEQLDYNPSTHEMHVHKKTTHGPPYQTERGTNILNWVSQYRMAIPWGEFKYANTNLWTMCDSKQVHFQDKFMHFGPDTVYCQQSDENPTSYMNFFWNFHKFSEYLSSQHMQSAHVQRNLVSTIDCWI